MGNNQEPFLIGLELALGVVLLAGGMTALFIGDAAFFGPLIVKVLSVSVVSCGIGVSGLLILNSICRLWRN